MIWNEIVSIFREEDIISDHEHEEAVYQSFDNSVLIHRCFEKIKEQSSASSDSYHVNEKVFETFQCLLYVRDQDLMLFEKLLEEEVMVRLEFDKLSCELKSISEELVFLKEKKGSLLKDLEGSEEKSALLRERLSMAVKKGKGLVQDRENLKNLLDENNSEIKKLKLELQQQESAVADCRDQIFPPLKLIRSRGGGGGEEKRVRNCRRGREKSWGKFTWGRAIYGAVQPNIGR
ncbi:hypothetical protein CJ030_MR6G019794 [Morella rubra]|uniref:Uncharacterized protein n=1 Tax=Morella rubra TaxID=262757 RepID=A0A6A1V659_9ROSI|nr:hypothetical protein CJ030_MR7G012982 [Morella rubra]KAB1210815.1 hypothetical protein CJ030_MR6G019794 [Morella rubra]